MEGDVGSRLVDGAQCRRVICGEWSVGRNFCSVVACGMSRELFDERFREWQEAVSGNNSRVVGDAEHGDIIRFLMAARLVEERPLTSKERRWMTTYHVVDYGVTQKLLKKGSELEVVKKATFLTEYTRPTQVVATADGTSFKHSLASITIT